MSILKKWSFHFSKSKIWLRHNSVRCLCHWLQRAPRGGRKWNEELTDRAWYCTSTADQSPANPCADSQDVALIHRPQPRFWGQGKRRARRAESELLGWWWRRGRGRGFYASGWWVGWHAPLLCLQSHSFERRIHRVSHARSMSNAWRSDRPTV